MQYKIYLKSVIAEFRFGEVILKSTLDASTVDGGLHYVTPLHKY